MSDPPLALSFRIESHERLASTQDALRQRLAHGDDVHGLVIRAGEQTSARGRRARDWQSGPGGSYQSLAVRDPAPPSLAHGTAALHVALGLAEVFPTYGLRVGVKWPNDLYYRGKKLAGILCEYSREHLLVGVGVNVLNDIPPGAVALRGWDLDGVHAVVLEGVQRGLGLLVGGAALPERFAAFDLLRDQPVAVMRGPDRWEGVAAGISQAGCLQLTLPSGEVQSVCDGHLIRYRLRQP